MYTPFFFLDNVFCFLVCAYFEIYFGDLNVTSMIISVSCF